MSGSYLSAQEDQNFNKSYESCTILSINKIGASGRISAVSENNWKFLRGIPFGPSGPKTKSYDFRTIYSLKKSYDFRTTFGKCKKRFSQEDSHSKLSKSRTTFVQLFVRFKSYDFRTILSPENRTTSGFNRKSATERIQNSNSPELPKKFVRIIPFGPRGPKFQ